MRTYTNLLFTAVLLFLTSGKIYSQNNSRPNILLIIVDDGRYADYQATGGPSWFNTPTISRIANEGANFKNTYAVFSLCEPSRVSILTGLYPHHSGYVANKQLYDTTILTMARILKDDGYYTGIVGKFLNSNSKDANSFVFPKNDFSYYLAYDGEGGYSPQTFTFNGKDTLLNENVSLAINDFGVHFLESVPSNSPFFLMFCPRAPHTPYKAFPGYKNAYHSNAVSFPTNFHGYVKNYPSYLYYDNIYTKDSAGCVDDIQTYYETLIGVEEGVDSLFSILENQNILDSTLVIYMSDNGIFIGEHFFCKKRLAYEESMHVPLFIRYPKWFAANTVIDDEFTLNVDIFPTVLEAAGIPDIYNEDGMSLHSIANKTNERKQFLYEYYQDSTAQKIPDFRAVRDFNYKYIRSSCDDVTEEFFDLQNDTKEDSNLVFNATYQSIIQVYRDRLDSMRIAIGDDPALDTILPCYLLNIDTLYPDPPVAKFTVSLTTVCKNGTTDFTDLSTNNPTSWLWTFQGGTPSTSTAKNPTGIVYSTTGTYNVTLTASNSHGSSTLTKTNFITVSNGPTAEEAAITADGPVSFCGSGNVVLSAVTSGLTYKWKKNGVNISGQTNQSYTAKKSATYTCNVGNSCGNTTSNAIVVTKNTKPTSTVTKAPCSNGSVLLTCTATPNTGVTYKWKKGSTVQNGATNPTFSATTNGTYKCTVTVTATGCTKTSEGVSVTINCKEGDPAIVNEFNIYPNPSNDYFVITGTNLNEPTTIKIYDLTGKLLESDEVATEQMKVGASLPVGMYFANIEVNGEIKQVIKLVKNQ